MKAEHIQRGWADICTYRKLQPFCLFDLLVGNRVSGFGDQGILFLHMEENDQTGPKLSSPLRAIAQESLTESS